MSDRLSVLAYSGQRWSESVHEIAGEPAAWLSGVLAALQRVQAEIGAIGAVR